MIPLAEAAAARWREVTRELASLAARVPPERWGSPGACGSWTNKELLIHLATGYVVRTEWLEAALVGRVSVAPPDIDEVNERNAAAWRPAPIEAVLAELHATRDRVLQLLERLTPVHLDIEFDRDGRSTNLGELLVSFSAHDLEHAAQLRQALQ